MNGKVGSGGHTSSGKGLKYNGGLQPPQVASSYFFSNVNTTKAQIRCGSQHVVFTVRRKWEGWSPGRDSSWSHLAAKCSMRSLANSLATSYICLSSSLNPRVAKGK